MIECFAGELFVFELTGVQLAAAGVASNQVRFGSGRMLDRMAFVQTPLVRLSQFVVQDGKARSGRTNHR